MTVISILMLNFVYPGLFFIATIFIIYRLRNIFMRYGRTVRIILNKWFKRRQRWYHSYVITHENLMSLRHLSKQDYYTKHFRTTLEDLIESYFCTGTLGLRWIGIRTAFLLGALTFYVYLCPFIQQYYEIWDFSKNIWILSIGLTWSARLTDYLSDWTSSLNGLMISIEAAERILELHSYDDNAQEKPNYLASISGLDNLYYREA